MKTILTIATSLFFLTNISFAQDFGEFRLNGNDISLPIPEKSTVEGTVNLPEIKPTPMKEWTVMVFMNGKNSLESEAIGDLIEMGRVGSNSNVNIIVELGRIKEQKDNTSNDVCIGTNIFYIGKNYKISCGKRIIPAQKIASLPKVNMGDSREVSNFVLWAKKYFPARKYMLVIWDHGSGWEKGNPVIAKGISDDEETGNNISTPQLGEIVQKIGDIEVLSFDACLMQMAEVIYEIKDGKVKYLTASEEIEPGSGYPYDKILFQLVSNPSMEGNQLSKIIVDEYIKSTKIPTATHSAIDMSKASILIEKMNVFAKAATASKEKAVIKAAKDSAKKYGPYNTSKYGKLLHRDLKDFVNIVAKNSKDEKLNAAAKEISDFISIGQLLVENKANDIGSNGVAVNMDILSEDYAELKIAKETQFDEFITWLLKYNVIVPFSNQNGW